MKWLRNN